MLIVDSREKWTQSDQAKPGHNVRNHFHKHKVDYTVQKLEVGDYMYPDGKVRVDRKQSLQELATNLMNRSDSARFWREVRRARELGIKLIVLIEQGGAYHSIRDVAGWKSQYSPVTGRKLMEEMTRLELAYGVRFVFCDKRSTGKKILELLKEEQEDEQ